MRKIIFFFFLFLNSLQPLFAQKQTYTSTSSKAIKSLENALKLYDAKQSQKAIAETENALKADPNFVEAYMLQGDLYADINQTDKAIESYKKAININPRFFPNNFYALGRYELELGRYEDAREHLSEFIKFENASSEKKEEAKRLIASCEFAVEAMKNPVPFKPENLGAGVNSTFDEYFPSITVDDKKMLFTRKIKSETYGWQEDFYVSNHDEDGSWGKALNVGPPVNTELNEGAPSYSADGQLIFFTCCDRPDGLGSCDIYYSRKFGDKWGRPINLGSPVNTGAWESQPSFSSDGKTLYFVRGGGARTGGKDQDIYMTQVSEKGWSTPMKLSNNINTDGKEEAVFIHPDNQTLYFVSDGWPGMGGSDIFLSKRQKDGTWGKPVNLGYPINTYANEAGLIVNPKGDKAYFSSSREGGLGGLDIYSFDLYDKIKPEPVSFVKGKVMDATNQKALDAKFEIIDLESGQTVAESYADKATGEFLVALPSGKNYALNASKKDYLFYSDHFEIQTAADANHAYQLMINLNPVKQGNSIALNNIFFDSNSATLKPESKTELIKLIAFLKQNNTIKIEVGGHTDSVGDDKANLLLSEKRAKSVLDYLANAGIDAARLRSNGYGESKPIATNDTEEGKAKNRRTEITILSVN
jgi:outer membrane protein OmpA-like peptidoglycan-associated protein